MTLSRRRFLFILRVSVAFNATVIVSALLVPRASGAADEKTQTRSATSPQQSEHARKPRPQITISRKTTYILEPLDQDGYVDYLAALNQMGSQGVTPENNAGVLLVRAIGVRDLEPADRLRFYKLLGIEPLPDQGQYLTDFGDFVKNKRHLLWTKKEEADLDRSTHVPWRGRELPLVDEWLKANEKPLELVVAATRRPQCYLPLVEPAGSGLQAMPLPCLEGSRNAARLLVARAMLHLGDGKIAEAEQDLLACHRLARLCGRTPFLIPALVAVANDATAFEGEAALIEFGRLSAERALAYQQELRKLAPLPAMADVIDKSERFMLLDTVLLLARERLRLLDALGLEGSIVPKAIERAFTQGSAIHWDDALLLGNEQFDKAVAAARRQTIAERKRAFRELDQDMRRIGSDLGNPEKFAASFLVAVVRRDVGRLMGKVMVMMLIPAVEVAFEVETRAHTREALGQIGFALAAYRADRGAYPDDLNAVVPKYISRVPNDVYTEQPLHYRRQGTGFLLYSVGANGVDDGGQTFDSKPPGDDIVLKISGDRRTKQ
jgi:hypothetical protein